MPERRFLGVIEVDSGTLVVGDPGYLLPRAADKVPGVDYSEVIAAGSDERAVAFGRNLSLLIQNFGGDGPLAVFGEFEDGEFMRLIVELEPIDLDEVEA